MTLITDAFGKLYTATNELLAEGRCQIDNDRGSVTLRPIVDTPMLVRDNGELRLELDNGQELALERVIRFRLNVPGVPPGAAYRLYFTTAERLRAGIAGGEG